MLYCKKCGKPIDGSYGSGKFCSRSCANSRIKSIESRSKTAQSVRNFYLKRGVNSISYDGVVRKCQICGKDIPTTKSNLGYYKNIKTCGSTKCLGKSRKNNIKDRQSFTNKLRENAFRNNFGGFNMHKIKYIVDGKVVDSTYEKILAEDLSKNNIRWERCKRFKYLDLKGKTHHYTPDFYLPDYNIYLDPKNDFLINNINPTLGYRDSQKIKWVEEQNKIHIIILDKEHLTWNKVKELI